MTTARRILLRTFLALSLWALAVLRYSDADLLTAWGATGLVPVVVVQGFERYAQRAQAR